MSLTLTLEATSGATLGLNGMPANVCQKAHSKFISLWRLANFLWPQFLSCSISFSNYRWPLTATQILVGQDLSLPRQKLCTYICGTTHTIRRPCKESRLICTLHELSDLLVSKLLTRDFITITSEPIFPRKHEEAGTAWGVIPILIPRLHKIYHSSALFLYSASFRNTKRSCIPIG